MSTLTLLLVLLFAPPPAPTTATCVGVEQCKAAAETERRAAELAKAEKKKRAAELAAAKTKLDTCKGLSACKKAEAELDALEKANPDAAPPPEPDGPTEADLAQARLELQERQEQTEKRRHQRRRAQAASQRPGTLVLGAGYAGFAFKYADSSLPYMDGFAWSARAYQNWFLSESNVQISLGSGFQGMHVYGFVEEQVPAYGPPIPGSSVAFHHITVPVEFRFGGPARDQLFIYGMIGGALGFAVATDSSSSAIAFVYQPLLLGAGAYGTLGKTNMILGGEVRTDIAGAAVFGGPPEFDIQLKFGFVFE